jgi:hypothetical protein
MREEQQNQRSIRAKQRRRYRLRHKLLLSLGILLSGLLLLEIGVRVFYPFDQLEYVADDETLHQLRPDQIIDRENADGTGRSHFVTINQQGFRCSNKEISRHSTVRVLALGDSYTFGSGVADSETFCAQLERLSAGQLRVINAGVPGWGIFQMEIRLCRVIGTVKPDYVLITIPQKDIFRQPFDSNEEREAYVRGARIRNTIRSFSRLATVIGRKLQAMRLAKSGQVVPYERIHDTTNAVGPSETYQSCWKDDQSRLLAMKILAEQHGARCAVVAWPQHSRNTSFFLREVARFGKEHGILTVNLSEALEKHDRTKRVLPDGHPNPFGHRIVAEEIFDKAFKNVPQS